MWNKIRVFIGLISMLNVHKVLCQGTTTSEETTECEPPWTEVFDGCYMFEKDNFLPWDAAQTECRLYGGDLLSISNKKELDRVSPTIRERITSMSLLEWWVGLRYNHTLAKWRWADNKKLNTDVINWAEGEPNNGSSSNPEDEGPKECGAITYRNQLSAWRCEDTSTIKAYVCELETGETSTDSPPDNSTSSTATTTAATTRTTTVITSSRTGSYPTRTTPSPTTSASTTRRPTETTTSESVTSRATGRTTLSSPTISSTDSLSSTRRTTSSPSTTRAATTEVTTPVTKGSTKETTTEGSTREMTTEPSDTRSPETTERQGNLTSPATEPTQSTSTADPTTTTDTVTTETTTSSVDLNDFIGCYSINHEVSCPPVVAVGIPWPRTKAGNVSMVDCAQGSGKATWRCQETPVVCWKGEPDVKSCTSETIRDLTNQADEILKSKNNSAATVTFMENLSDAINHEPSSEQDLFQSTKLMATAAKANPENEQAAKEIVEYALKCGSGIISNTRDIARPGKDKETQALIASSLLGSMEDITKNMMKAFKTPAVVNITESNMEVEFHVVDLESMAASGISSVKYEGKSNLFSVPAETLKNNDIDGMAKLVFIQYDKIGELLEPANQRKDSKMKRKIISDVLSASIGQSDNQPASAVPQTITFTFKTGERVGNDDWEQLCSFLNFSLGYTGAWSQRGCWLKTYNDTHTTCQCNHTTNFAILMDIHSTAIPSIHAASLTYITYVGCIISIICLFLSWVTFTCLSSVQGERNSIHKHLVFCLFVAEVLFLAGVERTDDKIACSIIAGFLHFFFLSSFSWMFVEGIHILFMLVQVFDSAKSRLKYYYLLGYGGPVIVVGVSAAVYHQGYGTDRYCWLTTERLFLWSFAGPVAFILLVNLMILIYAMASVCKHSEYVFTKDKSTAGNMKGWIQGALALEVLLGLTWVFGYFYISEEALAMAYLFTIFNSLQGLFIFIFHCLLNKKVQKEYQKFIDYKPPTSGTHTTSKSANGTAGQGTGSSGLPMNSRKKSGFSDISIPRHGSSSA